MLKRFVLTFLLLTPTITISGGLADKSKSFVENLGREVVEKVSDVNISDNQRLQNFKKLYLSTFDNYYISRFVLGRYWRTIDTNIQKQFVKSFNKYIVATYAPKFKGWEGNFKATDSLFENNYYNELEIDCPANQPLLQQCWKLKPPVTPSIFNNSPCKCIFT